jgi:inner membrane transporter RhtA
MVHANLALDRTSRIMPPHLWFGVSAVFHYLGPTFAILLFPAVGVLGVAWLRIASAALVFGPFTRPWKLARHLTRPEWVLLLAFGACLAVMNCSFYLALDRLPVSLVAAVEFVGTMAVAFFGLRTRRNLAALGFVAVGVFVLIDVRWSNEPVGLFWAFLNGLLFVIYIILGHRIAQTGAGGGIQRLGAAMAIAFVVVSPIGLLQAAKAFADPKLLAAGVGVGICSSVIPYVCDQLAMARLPRASFALLLALLPAIATILGAAVLGQVPSVRDVFGVILVMSGIAIHKPAASSQ